MNRLLLVDGHNLLFRMFYGMPDNYRTSSGVPCHAVVGFGRAVANAIADLSPTRMLVLFDTEECGDRRSLDTDYKANRPDYSALAPEECPFTQLPAIYALLEEMTIPYVRVRGCEADDCIAAYALSPDPNEEVLILSTDRDYWQLVSPRVSAVVYQGGGCTLVDEAAVLSKLGVTPRQVADFKCLVGDASDNIAGVPGVGPKTAARLLAAHGTLEGIAAHVDELRPAIREAFLASGERLKLNRRLILLDGSAPLPLPREALTLRARRFRNLTAMALSAAERTVGMAEDGDDEDEDVLPF